MMQYMRENKIGIALVSEPNVIPGGNWLGEARGAAAIYWEIDESGALVERGKGYVAVASEGYILISTYCSPNVGKREFVELLTEIEINDIAKNKGGKIIMGGDLNARSKLWDRKYNTRGYYLEEWVAANELVLMNDGKDETCIRAQGTSMMDITLGTEAAMKTVRIWEVGKYTETLSDHKYIKIIIDKKNKKDSHLGGMKFPRWNLRKMDKDWFTASVLGGNWLAEKRIANLLENGEISRAEQIMKRVITDACDNAATRDKGNEKARNRVYW